MSKQLSPLRHPILWVITLIALALAIRPAFTQDASSLDTKVKVGFSGYVLNRTTGTFDTGAALTNISAETFQAPISLVITSISSPAVTLANSAGNTASGKPYVAVPVPSGGFLPGNIISNVALKFKNTNPAVAFTFTYSVVGTLPPIADAGKNLSSLIGKLGTLDGSASRDPQGKLLTYAWRIAQAPVGSKAALLRPTTPNPQLTPDLAGSYIFELIVSNGILNSQPARVTLTASAVNAPPIARAGNPQNARIGTVVNLDGSASSDPEGAPLIPLWSFVSVPAGSTLTDASIALRNALKASFTPDKAGIYTVRLAVSDGALTANDTVSITVVPPNVPPNANAGPDVLVNIGASVTLNGTSTVDPDAGPSPLTYRWTFAAKPATSLLTDASILNSTTAQPSFTPDKAGTYQLKLTVSDGEAFVDDTALVTVNSIPKAVDDFVSTNKNTALDISVLTNDSDADGDPMKVITLTAPVNGSAVINANSTVKYTPKTDFTGVDTFNYTISDGKGGTASAKVSVTVGATSGTNTAPKVTASAAQTIIIQTEPVIVTGMVSDDGLPNPPGKVTTLWSKTSGPGTVTFINPAALTTAVRVSAPGLYRLRLTASDSALSAFADLSITANASIAPSIAAGVATTTLDATKFLYSGANPIQTGVSANAIDVRYAVGLRGRVLTKAGAPLTGVKVTILRHPELGQTLTRGDGFFDMAAHGGGVIVVNYEKPGYFQVQRSLNPIPGEWRVVPDVVLIQADPAVTTINLAAPGMKVAQSSLVTDSDGSRRHTLFFPQGVTAQMVMPDNSRRPISTLSIRGTEYTVGANGPDTMPADLPPASAYTSAVVFIADEAKAAGAKDVVFSAAIPMYLENFLKFPVGTEIPLGSYEPDRAAWVASDNGRVIKILSIVAGSAVIDINGDGIADDGSALGITAAEKLQLAKTYSAGQTLWRVKIDHFDRPWDCNMGIFLDPDAVPPTEPEPADNLPDPDPDHECGSIIECQNQALGESISVTGTPLTINYRSSHAPGNKVGNELVIPVSTHLKSLPGSLVGFEVDVTVGGRFFHRSLPLARNQFHIFTWDGKDAFGRTLLGRQRAHVRVSYLYLPAYSGSTPRFAYTVSRSGGARQLEPARVFVKVYQQYSTFVGSLYGNAQIDGWTLSEHHSYDTLNKTLSLGNGKTLSSDHGNRIGPVIGRLAGDRFREEIRFDWGDGKQANRAFLGDIVDIAKGPDGSIYVLRGSGGLTVRRIFPDGTILRIAGSSDTVHGPPTCFPTDLCGDGGPATLATFGLPKAIAVGADNSVYVADFMRIRKIDSTGIITTVAGTGVFGFSGDGGPATKAQFDTVTDLVVANDGTIYLADYGNRRIRMIDTGGLISTYAGKGAVGASQSPHGDGGPAVSAYIGRAEHLALAQDGSLYFTSQDVQRLRRVRYDGIIENVMGIPFVNSITSIFDGAVAADSIPRPLGKIDIGMDGTLYFVEDTLLGISGGTRSIRYITPQGILQTLAGLSPAYPPATATFPKDFLNGVPARDVTVREVSGLVALPDGSVLNAERLIGPAETINRISSAYPGASATDVLIPSEDGLEIYRFNLAGRHLTTINALTNAEIRKFGYDASGKLTSVTDGNNNVTTIERDAAGNATAIVAPFGQRSTLTVDGSGYLATVTNPAGETKSFTYTDGLMQSMTDAKANTFSFQFDAVGRLLRDTDPSGGFKQISRTQTATDLSVIISTALNRTTRYDVSNVTNGQVRTTTDPAGLRTKTTRDTNGTWTTATPDSAISTIALTADPRWGMLAPFAKTQTAKLPSGLTAAIGRDRRVVLSDPLNTLSLTSLMDAVNINGRSFVSTFDAASKTFTLTTPENRKIHTTIDNQGRALSEQQASLAPINYHYDLHGRLDALTQGAGVEQRQLQIAYRPDGYVDFVTDPIGRQVKFTYDGAGRVKTQTLPDGRIVNYSYDANGNLIGLTPPGKPQHTFNYTPVDLQGTYTPPTAPNTGTVSTNYSYNKDRQLTLVTRPDGKTITPGYDTAGRLNTLTLPTGSGALTYNYDATSGNLSAIAAPGGVNLGFSYDGSLLKQTTWSGAISGSVSRVYDNNFRVTEISVNGSTPITFNYDNDNLLKKAGDLTITRDPANGLVTGTTVGVVTDSYVYNGFPEMAKYTAKAGGTSLFDVTYIRDKLGRSETKTEIVQGVTSVFKYGYDLAGRLSTVQKNGTTVESYSYDSNGNRLTGPGVSSATYDAQDRLLTYGTATYTYTANGELKTKTVGSQTTTYDYDVLGNLRAVTLPDGKKIEYIIDGQQRRIGKKVNGTLVQGFIYQDGLRPIAELDGAGNIVSRFVYSNASNVPTYMLKGGVTYRFVTDQVGSPRLIINHANGAVAQKIDYDSFGNIIIDSNRGFQPFSLAGGILDQDSRLGHFGARDYDPVTGRWTSKDPILFAGRDANLYAYANGNPVSYIDPLGLVTFYSGTSGTAAFGPWGLTGGEGSYLTTAGEGGFYNFSGDGHGGLLDAGYNFGFQTGGLCDFKNNSKYLTLDIVYFSISIVYNSTSLGINVGAGPGLGLGWGQVYTQIHPQ